MSEQTEQVEVPTYRQVLANAAKALEDASSPTASSEYARRRIDVADRWLTMATLLKGGR